MLEVFVETLNNVMIHYRVEATHEIFRHSYLGKQQEAQEGQYRSTAIRQQ